MLFSLGLVLLFPQAVSSICDAELCETYSSHSATDFVQVREPHQPVTLAPVARTYVTDDLDGAVEWFTKLLQTSVVLPLNASNVTLDPSCAQSKTVEWIFDTQFTFVQYTNPYTTKYLQAAEDQWMDVWGKKYDYTRWMDNHDGFQCEPRTINETYHELADFPIQQGGVFSRYYIPRTIWNLELSGNVIIENTNKVAWYNPERVFDIAQADYICRVPESLDENGDETPFSPNFWWKSTFASADPNSASDFVEKYLFADVLTSEYSIGGNCTLSTWLQLPGGTYQLHFARTSPCETPSPTVAEWVEQQESIRSLESGKFDQHMSNNLVLWSNSLDPFVAGLNADNQPYLLFELNPGIYALYVTIPRNGIVLQIRSDDLTIAEPVPFDACADTKDNSVNS